MLSSSHVSLTLIVAGFTFCANSLSSETLGRSDRAFRPMKCSPLDLKQSRWVSKRGGSVPVGCSDVSNKGSERCVCVLFWCSDVSNIGSCAKGRDFGCSDYMCNQK